MQQDERGVFEQPQSTELCPREEICLLAIHAKALIKAPQVLQDTQMHGKSCSRQGRANVLTDCVASGSGGIPGSVPARARDCQAGSTSSVHSEHSLECAPPSLRQNCVVVEKEHGVITRETGCFCCAYPIVACCGKASAFWASYNGDRRSVIGDRRGRSIDHDNQHILGAKLSSHARNGVLQPRAPANCRYDSTEAHSGTIQSRPAMSVALITGSAGLIGSEAARHFASLGYHVVGVDNDMRRVFFGDEASTRANGERLQVELGSSYEQHDLDIRDRAGVDALVKRLGSNLTVVIHAAAQPSHDWAAREPFTDFDVNAGGTLNLLEAVRQHAPDAAFVHMSTNKVYGDTPNGLEYEELDSRWELPSGHRYEPGIDESMSIDTSLHSVFGASKVAGDVMVQEYGRYFDMKTACFRGGTLTGPAHAATELHGFLGYVMRCTISGTPYTVHGYAGKQVRDAIHSHDLVRALAAFAAAPRSGEVYNIGGGRHSNCSVLEAIALSESITGRQLDWTVSDTARIGDHIWWISDNGRFASHYPEWQLTYDVPRILSEIHEHNLEHWTA